MKNRLMVSRDYLGGWGGREADVAIKGNRRQYPYGDASQLYQCQYPGCDTVLQLCKMYTGGN